MVIDHFELAPSETNYFNGKSGSTLLALVGSVCGALVLYDTQGGVTVVQGRNRDDPSRFDPKKSNSELLSVLESAGIVRASCGPPAPAICFSYGCDYCACVNKGGVHTKHWGCTFSSLTAPGIAGEGVGVLQYPCYLAARGGTTGAGWSNKNTPVVINHILKHLLAARSGGIDARDGEEALISGEAAIKAMVARQEKVVRPPILPRALHVLTHTDAIIASRRLYWRPLNFPLALRDLSRVSPVSITPLDSLLACYPGIDASDVLCVTGKAGKDFFAVPRLPLTISASTMVPGAFDIHIHPLIKQPGGGLLYSVDFEKTHCVSVALGDSFLVVNTRYWGKYIQPALNPTGIPLFNITVPLLEGDHGGVPAPIILPSTVSMYAPPRFLSMRNSIYKSNFALGQCEELAGLVCRPFSATLCNSGIALAEGIARELTLGATDICGEDGILPVRCRKAKEGSPGECLFIEKGWATTWYHTEEGPKYARMRKYLCGPHSSSEVCLRVRLAQKTDTEIAQIEYPTGVLLSPCNLISTCGVLITTDALAHIWNTYSMGEMSLHSVSKAIYSSTKIAFLRGAQLAVSMLREATGYSTGSVNLENEFDSHSDAGIDTGDEEEKEEEDNSDDAALLDSFTTNGSTIGECAFSAGVAKLTQICRVLLRRVLNRKKLKQLLIGYHQWYVRPVLHNSYFPALQVNFGRRLRMDGVFWLADLARYHTTTNNITGQSLCKPLGRVFMTIMGDGGVVMCPPFLSSAESRKAFFEAVSGILAEQVRAGGAAALTSVFCLDNCAAFEKTVTDLTLSFLPGYNSACNVPGAEVVLCAADIWHRVDLFRKALAPLHHSDDDFFIRVVYSTFLCVRGTSPPLSTLPLDSIATRGSIEESDAISAAAAVVRLLQGTPHTELSPSVLLSLRSRLCVDGFTFARNRLWHYIPGLSPFSSGSALVPPEVILELAREVGLIKYAGDYSNVEYTSAATTYISPLPALSLFSLPSCTTIPALKLRIEGVRYFFSRCWKSETFDICALGLEAAAVIAASGSSTGKTSVSPLEILSTSSRSRRTKVDTKEGREAAFVLQSAVQGANCGLSCDSGVAGVFQTTLAPTMLGFISNNRYTGDAGGTNLNESFHSFMRRWLHHNHSDLHTMFLKLDMLSVRFNHSRLQALAKSEGLIDAAALVNDGRGGAVRALKQSAGEQLSDIVQFKVGAVFDSMKNKASPAPVAAEEVAALLEGLAIYNDSTCPLTPNVEKIVRESLLEFGRRGKELLGEFATLEDWLMRVKFPHMGDLQGETQVTKEQLRYYFRAVRYASSTKASTSDK